MSDLSFEAFTKKVILYFQRFDTVIQKNEAHTKPFIEFLYERFRQENRSRITSDFLMRHTAKHLNILPGELYYILKNRHHFRKTSPHVPFSELFSQARELNTKSMEERVRLIYMLGRKTSISKWRITHTTGSPITPARQQKIRENMAGRRISFSPIQNVLNEEHAPRERALSMSGKKLERDIRTSTDALWRETTPAKGKENNPCMRSPYRLQRRAEPQSPSLSDIRCSLWSTKEQKQSESFEFVVTRETLLSRIDQKRPVGQKQVMGGQRAIEAFRAAGFIVEEKLSRFFHWSHRQGWLMGGMQSRDNLDPATAGSNYDTLFKVEAPIANLLLKEEFGRVLVNGEVEFKPGTSIPFRITFCIDCGVGKPIEVVIDPLSTRRPTIEEYEVAKTLFSPDSGFR